MEFQQELEALYQKALELKSQNHLSEAEALEVKAASLLARIRTQAEQNPGDPETASQLLYLAERDWALRGDQDDIQTHIQQALALREQAYGPEHALTAEALTKLAEFHFLSGRFGVAEPLYRRSLAIFEKHEKGGYPLYAKALEGLAQILTAAGHPQEADSYFERAIDKTGSDEQGKRSLYFLLIYRAEGLEKLNRSSEAEILRQKASALLPKTNPGEFGYRV